MSGKQRRIVRKANPSPARARRPRWAPTATLLAVVGAGTLAVFVANREPPRRATIVDQLSLTAPNEAFVESATATLRGAGHDVDYDGGTDVTVRFFQSLPARQDDVVVLRMHSARIANDGTRTDDVALFTGERIDPTRYELCRLPDAPSTALAQALATRPRATGTPAADSLSIAGQSRTIPVFYDPKQAELPWFGLRPTLIERDLTGSFKPSSVVVLMGCDGLRSNLMADAFTRKGAGTFISWDHPVSGPHTDASTERLLELMVTEGMPAAEGVKRTMAEEGPDPDYDGRLVLYTPPSG